MNVSSGSNSTAFQCGQGQFDNIPAKLRAYRNWVLYRLELRPPMVKPTKVPYVAEPGGKKASSTDPSTWRTFEQCLLAPLTCTTPVDPDTPIELTGYSGIGFNFSGTPYCGIDVDNDPEMAETILALFPSYAELSQSGNGIHVIAKGSVPSGKRRGSVEVYSESRYFAMTGNVIRNLPIVDCQQQLDALRRELDEIGSDKAGTIGTQPDREATQSDAAVVEALCRDPELAACYAANESALPSRFFVDGKWDWSSVDIALCNSLAVRSGNRAQVERIWLASPLGQREKTQKRADYRKRTIKAAFNLKPLNGVDLTGVTAGDKAIPFGVAPSSPSPGEAMPTLWDAGDWEGQEPKPQIEVVPGLILAGHLNSLYGDGGNYKTLLSQHLLTSMALGTTFLGRLVMPGTGIMLNCEDDQNRLHWVQANINRHHNCRMSDLAGKLFFACRAGWLGNDLVVFDSRGNPTITKAYEQLKTTIIETKALVVALGNVAHLFGGNENDRNQVATFLVLLERLAIETGAAILLIGHYNKQGQVSGSTAWKNQVRNVIVIEKVEGKTRRIIKVEKSNYLKTGIWAEFEWQDGVLIAVDDRSGQGAALDEALAEQSFLACLAAATESHRAISHIPGINYFGKIFPRMAEANGVDKLALEAAFERLLKRGTIQVEQRLWQAENRHWKIGIKLRQPPAPTPCANPRQPLSQVIDFTCADPARANPLITYGNREGALGASPPLEQKEGGDPMSS